MPTTWPALRALHTAKQHLCAPTDLPAAALCDALGWPRTLGGVDGYVLLWARNPSLRRAHIDAAAADLAALRVVPAARSCIMMASADTAALALRLGYALWWQRTQRDLDKLAVGSDELDALCDTAMAHLPAEGATTDAWRRALPDGAVRSLGDADKKIGISSTFPIAIRVLEGAGRVSRVPDPDLVGQRYRWLATPERAAELDALPAERADLAAPVAARYLQVAGPATARELADWSGLPVGACKRALAAMESEGSAEAIALEGSKDPVYATPDDSARLSQPPEPMARPQLLSFIDPWLDHRNAMANLVDPAHTAVAIPATGGRPKPIGQLKGLWTRAIIDDHRLVGLWDWDPDSASVVTGCFAELAPDRAALLAEQAERLTGWLREDFGHGRCFSIDSDKAQRRRVERVLALSA